MKAFYARQHVMLSASLIRPSVTLLYCVKTTQLSIMKSSLCDSLESLVSNEVILVPLGDEIPLERRHQRGTPLRNRYFTTIASTSVKTVADRHRLAACHNKHCWRAFQWYQHRWPWTTLKRKIGVFSEFVAILGCNTHFKSELCRNHSR